MSEPIQIWAFYEAPEELQALSDHGGDEDWLALLPEQYAGDEYEPRWMMDNRAGFGVCEVSIHPLPDGREVRIGVHA